MKTAPSTTIYLIAAFKLFKTVLLTLTGLAALHLVHRDIGVALAGWAHQFHVDPQSRLIHKIFEKALGISSKQLKEVAAGTFFYAALCLTEGVGLLMRQRWAEYFTVTITALFVPLEIYELIERLTLIRVLVLIVNLGIVWYLAARLKATEK